MVIGVIVFIKSMLEGTPGREVVFIVMHTMPYIAMAISSLGVRGMGTWKVSGNLHARPRRHAHAGSLCAAAKTCQVSMHS